MRALCPVFADEAGGDGTVVARLRRDENSLCPLGSTKKPTSMGDKRSPLTRWVEISSRTLRNRCNPKRRFLGPYWVGRNGSANIPVQQFGHQVCQLLTHVLNCTNRRTRPSNVADSPFAKSLMRMTASHEMGSLVGDYDGSHTCTENDPRICILGCEI